MIGQKGSKLQSVAAPHPSSGLQGESANCVLTVAGFDPSSGAGVTADLQTFASHGLFGTAVVTALTVQSTLGVSEVQAVEPGLVRRSIAHLVEDMPPRGIKIGMLGTVGVLGAVADSLRIADRKAPVVLDPVLRSSSGHGLFPQEAVDAMHEQLLSWVDWVTPNWRELGLLSGRRPENIAAVEEAMVVLGKRHPRLTIVATGGDCERPVDLLRLPDGVIHRLEGEHIETRSTHGTGCAFSSALLAKLVAGATPVEAVAGAKHFVQGALHHAPGLGGGRGPLDLLWPLRVRA